MMMDTRDPTDLRSLETDDEARRQLSEFKARQETEDLKWLMAHKQGRRIVWRWLEEAGVFHNPFHTSGSVTAFNCGVRNSGLALFSRVMSHTPEAFVVMQREARNDD